MVLCSTVQERDFGLGQPIDTTHTWGRLAPLFREADLN